MPPTKEQLFDIVAIRCFRDVADDDYISARMAYRARLLIQFLWASQQAIEKYLKCILLLERIPAPEIGHGLKKALALIQASPNLSLHLTRPTVKLIEELELLGVNRYLENSTRGNSRQIIELDRAVWELRRFCTRVPGLRELNVKDRLPIPPYRIPGGRLESVIAQKSHPAREPLLWMNAFVSKRQRKTVRLQSWFEAKNSPFWMNPEILDELVRLMKIPKGLAVEYRRLAKSRKIDRDVGV